MSHTFISIRVSSKEQASNGASLPVQVRECLAYCKRKDLTLHPTATNVDSPGVFADPGVSAWKVPLFSRPGFRKLWDVMQPGDNVVFLAFDRAFRSVRDFNTTYDAMKVKGVTPIFVRDDIKLGTAAGDLWATVRCAFAQYQSDILSERIREAFAIRRAAGIRKGEAVPKNRVETFEASPDIRKICENVTESKPLVPRGRVFGYVRVSTDGQDSTPQRLAIESEVASRIGQGYSDGGIHVDDGVSAFRTDFRNRPAGKTIWSQLQPGDLIVVTRLDRIFRSTVDMGLTIRDMDKVGASFADRHSEIDTSTIGGRMLANFMCIMAQWESESISWRVKLGMKEMQRKNGPWQSHQFPIWVKKVPLETPIGDKEYRIEVIPEIIRDMTHMRELSETGLNSQEVSDVIQREHEIEHDFPISIPRCGLGKRITVESRLRGQRRIEDAERVRRYCEKFNIARNEEIDRHYSLNELSVLSLVYDSRESGSLGKYLSVNGSGGIF